MWFAANRFLSFLKFRRSHRLTDHSVRISSTKASHPESAPSLPVDPTERRQSPRRLGDPVEVFLREGDTMAAPMRGWIKNRSAGGLGLSVAEAVAEGTVLEVRTTLAPATIPWVQVEVKSCHPQIGRWMLHCRYVGTPPTETVLLFR